MNILCVVFRFNMLFASVIAVMSLLSGAVNAQAWPTRNVTVIVPLSAGTGMDSLARLYSTQLSKSIGKPVIVDNRPGAGFQIGLGALAKAPADGHTLGISSAPAMTVAPLIFKQFAFDPQKDFTPISMYVKSPFILVVNPTLSARTVSELIRTVKDSKGSLSFSSPGGGSWQHLSIEYMKQKFGLDIVHVPYKSSPQSVLDIAAGHVNMGFAEVALALPLIKEGKLRALAVSSSVRLPGLPEVPTFAEASNTPDFEAVSWHVLLAPAGTPPALVARLQAEMKMIMATPEAQQSIASLGLLAMDSPNTDGINRYIKAEREKWGGLVKSLGLEGSQ